MTLRTRMVTGLVLLVAVGLGVFGVATYSLYARSQYRRLDTQLRSAAPQATLDLYQGAFPNQGGETPHPGSGDGSGDHRPPQLLTPGTYGALFTDSGSFVYEVGYAGLAKPSTDADVTSRVGQL